MIMESRQLILKTISSIWKERFMRNHLTNLVGNGIRIRLLFMKDTSKRGKEADKELLISMKTDY